MKEKKKLLTAITIVVFITFLSKNVLMSLASTRDIENINNFTVYFQTTDQNDKYTGWCMKYVSYGNAVINLKDTVANGKNITATMRNSNGEARGSTSLYVGTRKSFTSNGKKNYNYRLGLRKSFNTDGLSATLYGSWSPDDDY